MNLTHKHVLVTGAAKRVGRALALALLAEGAKVTAHYFRSENDIKSLDTAYPGKVFPYQADLRSVSSITEMVNTASAQQGPIDILINSASDFYPTPIFEVSEQVWDDLFSLNLKGQFFLAKACALSMQREGGAIINIADVNGTRPMKNFTPYVTSKGALLTLTRNLALEWAPRIRVNSISPGAVCLPENYTEAQRDRAIRRTLLGRLGSPDDIVHAMLFLLRNDYVTGFDLKVDGGRSLVAYS